MLTQRKIPAFAAAGWYADPNDHRCPHDAWLEVLEVGEIGEGDRQAQRKTTITIRLLGAYHDGHIVFRYSGVTRYSLHTSSSVGGVGDWLRDELSASGDGLLEHRITWCRGADSKSEWFIEAEDVSYEWIPTKS